MPVTKKVLFDKKQGKCYNLYIKGATDRRSAHSSYSITKITAILGRGRLFLCFSMMISNRISDAEASSGKCQNCYQPFYRQHNSRPPF